MTLRRGLVLEGGGAKGAWQFGVLKALAERGLKFDAVSGTSVGALNSAIWCANRIDLGERLWNEMSLSHVFLQRPWLIPVLVVGGLAQLYLAFLNSFIPPDDALPKPLEWFFSALTVLPMFIAMVLVFGEGLRGDHWVGMLVVVPAAVVLLGFTFFNRTTIRLQMLLGLALLAGQMIATDLWGPEHEFIGLWYFWVALAPVFFLGLAFLMRFVNLSYFSPKPLTKTIELVLNSGLNIPLFATAAREVFSYLDPDNVEYVKEDENSEYRYPLWLSTMAAEYSRIDNMSLVEAREGLLASSALPFGIVPARRDNKHRRLVDGGMADNLPWFPFIEMFPCDEIIIIKCGKSDAWDDQASRQLWQIKCRLTRVLEAKVRLPPVTEPTVVHNDPPIEIPYQVPSHWPSKVTIIAPSEDLGTFRTGTLNFSNKSTTKWMNAGYEMARTVPL
ncbi:patatin-like phospholipase family protein [Bradyrhizobium sp. LB11.1]|uniref:patatin-like phospholipase family protein n=1 Tax=Bradyrhizobium sp. LB11.1 TaxID=3156326 RepID=UPI003391DB8A